LAEAAWVAYRALLAASCGAEISTEHIYLALITPSEAPDEHGEVRSSSGLRCFTQRCGVEAHGCGHGVGDAGTGSAPRRDHRALLV